MASIEDVKHKIDLVEVVGMYTDLKLHNDDDHIGCCPIHNESTPSLFVSQRRWKCFGCGRSGDAINFIMEMEGLSFLDAMHFLLRSPVQIAHRTPQPIVIPEWIELPHVESFEEMMEYWELPSTLEGRLEAHRRVRLMLQENFNPFQK